MGIEKTKIKVGDLISDGISIGIVENFQRNGNWVQIHWAWFTDIYSTKFIYDALKNSSMELYKKVDLN